MARKHVFAFASLLALAAASEAAAEQAPAAVGEVIVTGTRATGLHAVDSPAPVQVLGSSALQRVGQPDLIQSLAQNVPSFTAQAVGGDTANLTLSARLRGLSPNDTLVLVDGKRRHGTANLAVLGGPYQGGAAADLNFIPVDSIDHVEVLTDGAAAQYGTDAIAGVVNIILKKNKSGGNVILSGGHYFDQGGMTGDATLNFGLAPVGDNSWLNLTFETRFHDHSNRGAIDPRVYNHDGYVNVGPGARYNAITQMPGYPNVNQISGDALYHLNVAEYSAGYDFANGWEVYSFGTYGHKNGQAFENVRMPTIAPTIWPIGFNPKEELLENDFGFTLGLKGQIAGWSVDLSSTYGRDWDEFHTEGSANANLAKQGSTQTYFYDGRLIDTQWTNNVDVSRDFNVGLATPLTVAFGVEQRRDTYQIVAGEPSSYQLGGAQSYPGFSSIVASNNSRENVGVYGDLAVSPIEALKLDAAVRFEHFSDFGDTTVYKFTGRYDFTPAIAVRGTISSGFRAPTLAEEHYSSVNVGPSTAFGQFPPDSAGAASLGFGGLKPEKSKNYSVGFVTHPGGGLTGTVDAYYIEIKDRIVGSGNIYGSSNIPGQAVAPAVDDALAGSGYTFPPSVVNTGINIFANGLDTRTYGVEGVLTYASDFADMGRVDWSLTGDYNDTKVTHVAPSPAAIAPQVLYDATAISILETASPKFRVIGNAVWSIGKFTVNLRETLYGPSSEEIQGDDGVLYDNKISTTGITDLEVSYKTDFGVRITLGANNLFNQYPDKFNAALLNSYVQADDNSAVGQYPDFSPFGINGGYYYAKLTYVF